MACRRRHIVNISLICGSAAVAGALSGSHCGNNTDLSEVLSLAAQGRIRHTIKTIRFDEFNEHIDLLRSGEIVGRAVVKF